MHAGLVGGRRGPILEFAVQHARVGVLGGGGPGRPVHGRRRTGQEAGVSALGVGGEAQHGAAGGGILGGEAPGDTRHRDQDNAHT